MSWLFSQALAAEYWAANCSDGAAWPPLNSTLTPQAYLCNGKMTDFSRPSRFGMTFAPLTDGHGAALLTWYRAGFPAKTSAPPAKAPASTGNAADYGLNSLASLARYDPASHSWKTPQCSLLEGLDAFSQTWPRWGLMQDGVCWALPTLERPTSENAYGSSLPTPTAQPMGSNTASRRHGETAAQRYLMWPKDQLDYQKVRMVPTRAGNSMRWETSNEYWARQMKFEQENPLADPNPMRWPTPTSSLGTKGGRITARKSRERGTLIEAVSQALWPTPNASDATKWNHQSLAERKAKGQQIRLNHQAAPEGGKGGSLNPTWVEWLMGWPLGWTDLQPLATAKYHNAQPQLGDCLGESEAQ